MRTTAAAATAVTSAAPLLPQPTLNDLNVPTDDEEHEEDEDESTEEEDDDDEYEDATTDYGDTHHYSRQQTHLRPSQTTNGIPAPGPTFGTEPYGPMNPAEFFSAYSNVAAAAGLDFNPGVHTHAHHTAGTMPPSAASPSTASTNIASGSASVAAAAHAAAAAATAFGNAPHIAGGTVPPAPTPTPEPTSMFNAAGFGSPVPRTDVSDGARRLVKELEDFVERGLEGAMAAERGDPNAPSEEAIAELQLQTARRLRQLLPANRDLLHLVQERNWIPLLLNWLNLHDRPAVQAEALFALTNIAELCAQQSYYQHAPMGPAESAAAPSGASLISPEAPSPSVMPSYYSFPPPGSTVASTTPNSSPATPSLLPTAGTTPTMTPSSFQFPAPATPGFGIAAPGDPTAALQQMPYQFPQHQPGAIAQAAAAASAAAAAAASVGAGVPAPATFPAFGNVANGFSPSPAPSTISNRTKDNSEIGAKRSKGSVDNETSLQRSRASLDRHPQTGDSSTVLSSALDAQTPIAHTGFSSTFQQFNFGAPPGAYGQTLPSGMTGPPSMHNVAPPFEWDARTGISPTAGFSAGAHAGALQTADPSTLPPLPPTSFPLNLPPLPFPSSFDGTAAGLPSASSSTDSSGSPPPPPPSSASPFVSPSVAAGLTSTPSSSMFLPSASPAMRAVNDSSGTSGFQGSFTAGATDFGGSSAPASIPQPLSASSQNLLLRHADAIPTLISLLSSPNREVHEQAMWILGSIAAGESPTSGAGSSGSGGSGSNAGGSGGGGPGSSSSSSGDKVATLADSGNDKKSSVAARDIVLANGVMKPLLRCLEDYPLNLSLQRIGSWALSNLVEGQFQQQSGSKGGNKSDKNDYSYSSLDQIDIRALLPTLRRLLHMSDAEVLSNTCWTLSHLCDGPSSHIAAVVTTRDPNALPGGLVPRLVDLLVHRNWRVTKPALRTIGNIVCAECGDDTNNHSLLDPSLPPPPTDYTEVILECDAVPRLKQLITHSNREIQKEACWTLSNIAAGTVDQIQAVIDSGAIPPLVRLVSDSSTDQEVRSEACWVVLNATSCGSDLQIEVLVDEGCVSVLGVLLGEPSMVMMALEGLERVLQVEEGREVARRTRLAELDDDYVEEGCEPADDMPRSPLVSASLIEKALEQHKSTAVTKRAGRIWKQHFVSCALCHQSFSRHRPADARFCNECKCHVCSNCDCTVYHLSYQEELWAAEGEKNEAKKNAKKSKKQKKKEKRKEKKARQQEQAKMAAEQQQQQQQQQQQGGHQKEGSVTHASTVTSLSDSGSGAGAGTRGNEAQGANVDSGRKTQHSSPPLNELTVVSPSSRKKGKTAPKNNPPSAERGKQSSGKGGKGHKDVTSAKVVSDDLVSSGMMSMSPQGKGSRKKTSSPSPPGTDDEDEGDDCRAATPTGEDDIGGDQPPIDFVLYLQQTGSIIALAKLMDALDYGDGAIYDEEVDAELQRLSRQQVLGRQATT